MSEEAVETGARTRVRMLGWAVLLLGLVAMVGAGCIMVADALTAQEKSERSVFSTSREREDGAFVEWSGYTDGYEPGAEATFDIMIRNQTEDEWPGRFCLQLVDLDDQAVVSTLKERPFNLEPGLGFAQSITVQLPENLDARAYGLSLVVRKPHGPSVDLVRITVGETVAERGTVSQADMDAALEACPEVTGGQSEATYLVTLAKEDLVERTGVSPDEIVVESINEAEFPDASLGVPDPGKLYAQVITPGYIIRLAVDGETYEYHGAGERVVLAAE